MSVPAAYLTVILIWSTTPLAIKWSVGGPGFLTGVSGRMVIGLALCLLLVKLLGIAMPWRREQRKIYLLGGFSIYGAMMSVYWGAQFLPSGLTSVVYGLSPIIMGIMASWWLPDSRLSLNHLLGAGLGFSGLAVIFADDLHVGSGAVLGILAVLFSTLIHCWSSVWIKRLNAGLHPLALTTGALLLAVPLFLLTWALSSERFSMDIPPTMLASMLYLGVFGTVVGWALYYYLLAKITAATASLVTLVTPVMALIIGDVLNGEVITPHILAGTAVILSGLAVHQWGGTLLEALRRAGARSY